MLCVATMTAGIVHLRSSPEPAASAVRAGSADGFPVAAPPQETPPAQPGPISLTELAQQIRSRPTTSTTKAKATTTTTVKRAAATPPSTPASTTTTSVVNASRSPGSTTSTTVPGTPLTTLLEKVVPPAAAVTGVLTRSDSGVASWFKAPRATCAHRTLPMGTEIKVTRVYNGATAVCTVDDRGPTVETGRLIDLSLDTFEKLAAREAGLIAVKIEW